MKAYWSKTGTVLLAMLGIVIGNGVVVASSHAAETPGEIGQVGSFGSGENGEFEWPTQIAVDPSDNSVYVVDDPNSSVTKPEIETSVRIQKFSAGLGKPVATVTVATPDVLVGGKPQHQVVNGLAVDPKRHRLYVLKAVHTQLADPHEATVGSEIDAFSTIAEEKGGKSILPPATGVNEVETAPGINEARYFEFPTIPTSTPVPAGTLGMPHGLAFDPSTSVDLNAGDLIVLGSDEVGNTLVQRIAGTTSAFEAGVVTKSFDDESHLLEEESAAAPGVAVAPNGTLYVATSDVVRENQIGIAALTSDFSTVSLFRKAEESPFPFSTLQTFAFESIPGSDIAVSPDTGVVYAFETTEPEFPSPPPATPGTYELAGFSSADKSQQIIYGGAATTAARCLIASSNDAVAAGSNGVVYVLDMGNVNQNALHEPKPSPFGFRLIEFGPVGSTNECPEPTTTFTVDKDGSSPTVKVQKGSPVAFLASGAELRGAEPEALTWKVQGPAPYEETITAGCPTTCLTSSHTFLKPGTYTVELQMKVKNSPFGPPPPVSRKLEVVAPPPTAAFTASSVEPQSGEEVTFNGEESLDPTGSPTGTPTHALKSYTWSFGDGQVETTSAPLFSRSFVNSGAEARSETVTLVVTSQEGAQSAPSVQTLTVKGTGGGGSGGGGGTGGSGSSPTGTTGSAGLVVSNPGSTPPPAIVGKPPLRLTRAQELAKALRQCRKLKQRKRRASCERAAKKKYGPPSHKKKHH